MAKTARNRGILIAAFLLLMGAGVLKFGGAWAGLNLIALLRNGNSKYGDKSPLEQIQMLQSEAQGQADDKGAAGAFNPDSKIFMTSEIGSAQILVYEGEDAAKVLSDKIEVQRRVSYGFRRSAHPPEILYFGSLVWGLEPGLVMIVRKGNSEPTAAKVWHWLQDPGNELYVM